MIWTTSVLWLAVMCSIRSLFNLQLKPQSAHLKSWRWRHFKFRHKSLSHKSLTVPFEWDPCWVCDAQKENVNHNRRDLLEVWSNMFRSAIYGRHRQNTWLGSWCCEFICWGRSAKVLQDGSDYSTIFMASLKQIIWVVLSFFVRILENCVFFCFWWKWIVTTPN